MGRCFRYLLIIYIIIMGFYQFGCSHERNNKRTYCSMDYWPTTGVYVGDSEDILSLIVGDELIIPEGQWWIDKELIINQSNLRIKGAGVGKTILHNADTINVIALKDAEDVVIEDLTIIGNIRNRYLGHCIRGDNARALTVRNAELRECGSYGIGLQAGTHDFILIENVSIKYTGADGLDEKQKEFTPPIPTNNIGNIIRNTTVHCPGQRGDFHDAGVDMRSYWTVENVSVTGISGRVVGIRNRLEGN